MIVPMPQPPMTIERFLDWLAGQPEGSRYELVAGEPVAMSPERLGHARVKHRVLQAFEAGIAAAGAGCEAIPDGVAVRIDATTLYEPDALVRCGPPLPDETVVIDDPVIIVEVVSPSSGRRDTGAKLEDYFRLPSVRHYLIVRTDRRSVVHHEREAVGRIVTHLRHAGPLTLDPPGITVPIEAFFTV